MPARPVCGPGGPVPSSAAAEHRRPESRRTRRRRPRLRLAITPVLAGPAPTDRSGAGCELSLRVGQLGSPATTARLAAALRRAVATANGRHPPLISTRVRRTAVQVNEDLMLALANRLGDGESLGPAGLAMTARLVADHSSPIYHAGASLAEALSKALSALDRGHRTAGR